MRTIRRLILLVAVAAAFAGAAQPADATCKPGHVSLKPLSIEFPECHPPGGGPN